MSTSRGPGEKDSFQERLSNFIDSPIAVADHSVGMRVRVWRRHGLARASEKLITSEMLQKLRIL